MAYDKGTANSGVANSVIISELKLNARQNVVSCLDVLEANVAGLVNNDSISLVLPTSHIDEVCCNWRVLVIRVRWVARVKYHSCARISQRNELVEEPKTVATV